MSAPGDPNGVDPKLSALAGSGFALSEQLVAAGLEPVTQAVEAKFDAYLRLLMRWNQRTNLTAVRDSQGIVSRHFVESIACAQRLPSGIQSLLDFGSGAGFPGIPIALCRPEIEVTLAESQIKKASFLREAVRTLELTAVVHANRAETLKAEFDCVALRAVDQMPNAVRMAARLVRRSGWMAILTTKEDSPGLSQNLGPEFRVANSTMLPGSTQRILILASRLVERADCDVPRGTTL